MYYILSATGFLWELKSQANERWYWNIIDENRRIKYHLELLMYALSSGLNEYVHFSKYSIQPVWTWEVGKSSIS